MTVLRAWLLAGVVVVAGCAAEARIERKHRDLARSLSAGRTIEAASTERDILRLATDQWGASAAQTLDVKIDLADTYACWRQGRRATELASESLEAMESTLGRSDPRLNDALVALARNQVLSFEWAAAERTIDRVAQICRRPESSNRWGSCSVDLDVVYLYAHAGAYRRAVDAYLAMDRRRIRLTAPDPPAVLTLLGRLYAEGGLYAEASWYLHRCLDGARVETGRPASRTIWSSPSRNVSVRALDAAHAFSSQEPICLEDLVEIQRKLGNSREAERLEVWRRESWQRGPDLSAALEWRVRQSDRAQHSDLLAAHHLNSLGYYYLNKGRAGDAGRAFREALRRYERRGGRDLRAAACSWPEEILDSMSGLAEALLRDGQLQEAESWYRRADERAARELNPQHNGRLELLARLARTQLMQTRLEEAESSWRTYLERAEQQRGRDHADYAVGLSGLAEVHAAAGRLAEARETRARAERILSSYRARVNVVQELPLPASLRSLPSPAN